MKKIISLLLSVVLCIVSLSVVSFSAEISFFGDVNNDAIVNNKDLGLLMQYLNNWNVTINITDSDVNIDGNINNKDYGLLMQFINNWDVKLGEKQDNDVNPEDYRGTEVTMATTVLSKYNEAGPVIYNFEKEYGIKVKEILITDNMYEVGSKIAAGVNVDIVKCNGDFPAVLSVLQPLTNAKLDYNDPLWDQNMFEFSSINGEPYLCNSIGNIWAENACVIYSKSMLKQAQCYTPEEYDYLGKWTWDSFFETAKQIDKLDGDIGYLSEINGCYISVEDMLGSVGCGVYNYKNGTFTNGLEDNFHFEAIKKLASYYRETNACSSASYDTIRTFYEGKVGIAIGNVQMLKKCDVNTKTYDWSDLGFYKMPAYEEGYQVNDTNRVVGWGICRGSHNPVGAGIFLKYYLDVNNYDISGSFITPAAEYFFFISTSNLNNNYTPYFTYEYSTNNISGFWDYDWEELTRLPDEYLNKDYNVVLGEVDKACINLNRFVEQYT